MGRVQQQFFPDSSRPEILLDLWFPEGTSIVANEEVTRRVEQRLMAEQGIASVSTWVGSGVPRFYLPMDLVFPQSNVSQLIVIPQDLKVREAFRVRLPALMAQEFPEVRARIKLLPNGPPVAYPVQFRVVGPEPYALRQRADEVKAVMRDEQQHARRQRQLERIRQGAPARRRPVQGAGAGRHQPGDRAVVAHHSERDHGGAVPRRRQADRHRAAPAAGRARAPDRPGQCLSADELRAGRFRWRNWCGRRLAWEPGVLWRENRDYAITVQGDIVEGLQGATVTAQLLPQLRALEARWAASGAGGYRIDVAGAVEESSKGSASIVAGVPIMLFITFTLLMLQLHSFSRAMLVFLTGPLGIAGVAGALLLFNRPFGFVALLGVIALMGMIQRNSVILIDQIEQDRAVGIHALGRDRREHRAAAAAHRADGRRCRAGHDSACRARCSGGRWRLPSWAAWSWPRC